MNLFVTEAIVQVAAMVVRVILGDVIFNALYLISKFYCKDSHLNICQYQSVTINNLLKKRRKREKDPHTHSSYSLLIQVIITVCYPQVVVKLRRQGYDLLPLNPKRNQR